MTVKENNASMALLFQGMAKQTSARAREEYELQNYNRAVYWQRISRGDYRQMIEYLLRAI